MLTTIIDSITNHKGCSGKRILSPYIDKTISIISLSIIKFLNINNHLRFCLAEYSDWGAAYESIFKYSMNVTNNLK
jgi:hypothetical protein